MFPWIKRKRYTGRVEDQQKVQAKIRELNSGKDEGPWDEVEGITIFTEVKLNEGKSILPSNRGTPVKVFINSKTGENRIFPAELFTKDWA